MSDIERTPSGLPARRTDITVSAARRALALHLPLDAADLTFAGVLRPVGDGTADLSLAMAGDERTHLSALAYALLMRACALAEESGDDVLAEACGDALDCMDDALGAAPAPVRQ